MPVGMELAIAGQSIHGALLPHSRITLDIIHYAGLQYEEPSVEPGAVALWLLFEIANAINPIIQAEYAKTPERLDGGQRCQPTVASMERDEFCDVDVTHAIAIRHTKRTVAYVLLHPPQAPARHGL